MADKQTDDRAEVQPPALPTTAQTRAAERIGVVLESEDARRSRGLAEAQAEATRLQMDEAGKGHTGHYLVNGVRVDADGKPVKD